MVLRRTDQRRRRVVMDEAVHALEAAQDTAPVDLEPTEKRKASKASRDYSHGAMRRYQLKTTDLIPKRFLSFSIVVLLLLAAMAGFNFLSGMTQTGLPEELGSAARALALDSPVSLTAWFSSFLLILSSLASLQIFALRQHRSNDYSGTYQVWLWFSLMLILASANCIVDLESIVASVAGMWNVQLGGRGAGTYSIAIKLAALAVVFVRGLVEVRASPATLALVVVGWIAYSLAVALQLPQLEVDRFVFDHESMYGNSLLLGTYAVLLANLSYARFVFLTANGLVKAPRATRRKKAASAKTKRAKVSKSRGKDGTPATASATRTAKSTPPVDADADDVDQEQERTPAVEIRSRSKAAAGPLASRIPSASTSAPQRDHRDEGDASDNEVSGRPLSKAEKRKMRKLQEQRRAA